MFRSFHLLLKSYDLVSDKSVILLLIQLVIFLRIFGTGQHDILLGGGGKKIMTFTPFLKTNLVFHFKVYTYAPWLNFGREVSSKVH